MVYSALMANLRSLVRLKHLPDSFVSIIYLLDLELDEKS